VESWASFMGAGIEQTFHDIENTAGRTVKMTGGFVEPRYVIDVGSDAAAPYLAGRFAVSQIFVEEGTETSSALGITVNGGGGVLVNLGSALNLDLGVTMGWKSLGRATISETVFDLGTGGNLIARAGLALGIGG